MSTQELYQQLNEEIENELQGQLIFDGVVLKWEYDGFDFLHDDLEEHLDLVAHEDKELINEILADYNEFIITEPETHDTFVYFYIEK